MLFYLQYLQRYLLYREKISQTIENNCNQLTIATWQTANLFEYSALACYQRSTLPSSRLAYSIDKSVPPKTNKQNSEKCFSC